jgi:hypothetical protein
MPGAETVSAALWIAGLWGFAEATFFFLVPDVWLSFLAIESFAQGVAGSLAALAGALNGGALMWMYGCRSPMNAFTFLLRIPGIRARLLDDVRQQTARRGLPALFLGPVRGIPYKIYAVESGASSRGLSGFLLVSIPARYLRFIGAICAFWLASRYPMAGLSLDTKRIVVALFWVAFYGWYFRKFGWKGR